MTSNKGEKRGFGRTIHDDIKDNDLRKNLGRDWSEVKEYFLSDERKIRLKKMGAFRRFFYTIFYLLEALFYKLNPIRRIITLLGFILIVAGDKNSNNTEIVGGILLLYVILVELKDKLIAHHELRAGHQVQRALMPESNPKIEGWDVWLFTRSANEVGGDLIDYLPINGNKYGVCLGDVAGKGLSASLLMAKLQATIRALVPEFKSLPKFADKLNKIFLRDSLPNFFASLIYFELEPDSTSVKYINAGHMPPVIVRKSGCEEMQKGDPALGLSKDVKYHEHKIKLEKDDLIILYSDGITEAKNEEGVFFGHDKMINMFSKLYGMNSTFAGEKIEKTIDEFRGEAGLSDDLSIAILRKL